MRGSTPTFVMPHDANTLHNMESITKSVIALLVGIAFDRGLLKNLDAPIFSFFPEYGDLRTPEKDQITLRHLLSMTSGLDWPERAISSNNPETSCGGGTSPPIHIVSCWSVPSKRRRGQRGIIMGAVSGCLASC
jgi:hypothetical protein